MDSSQQPGGWAPSRLWGLLPRWVMVDSGWHRSAGQPELDLVSLQLWTLFQKTGPHTSLPSPKGPGSPGSTHISGVALWLSEARSAASSAEQRGQTDSWSSFLPGHVGSQARGLQGTVSRQELGSQGALRCAGGLVTVGSSAVCGGLCVVLTGATLLSLHPTPRGTSLDLFVSVHSFRRGLRM